jgi:MFS family permease
MEKIKVANLANEKKTRLTLLISSVFHEPLACLFIWLPFILRKDCHATAFQISLLATLKPIVSLFSFYWSHFGKDFGLNHKKSVLLSGVLARLLFLFFPFFHSIEFVLSAATIYLFFSRATMPSWMEILKLNLNPKVRQKWFSLSSVLGYLEGIILAIGLGALFDTQFYAWRFLFAIAAFFGILATIFQSNLPEPPIKKIDGESDENSLLIKPLKEAILLLRKRKDFALFQLGFMFGGFGIMLANVICPLFFVDILKLSHVDYANARYLFMGLGFILFSFFWQKQMEKFSIFNLTLKICFGFAGFIGCLMLSQAHLYYLYAAFFLYGVSQAGSHLVWHLSGPLFAKEEDSTIYSSVNLFMVGIRGLVGPIIGSYCYVQYGPFSVFSMALAFCLLGGLMMLKEKKTVLVSPTSS